jgi:hypothetical protein
MSLAAYLLAAMMLWVPAKLQPEGQVAATARYESIAADVAEVVERDDEPAIYGGSKTLTALVVLSIAKSESAFWKRVDDGECREDECDAGEAVSLWQFHPGIGLAFDGDGWRYDASGYQKKDFIADRKLAARMTLHLLRGPHQAAWDGAPRRDRAVSFAASHQR